jgi:8-amino-7-oxononanoate synthase
MSAILSAKAFRVPQQNPDRISRGRARPNSFVAQAPAFGPVEECFVVDRGAADPESGLMGIWEQMLLTLRQLKRDDLLRELRTIESPMGPRVTLGGRQVRCFCGNDYLCLANDAAVRKAAIDAIEKWGIGAGGSRLICGTQSLHAQLESCLADFKQTEAALVLPTGWMANHAAVSALAGEGDLVLCDKLNHASIIDAARACGAVMRTYPHRDVRRLGSLLDRLGGKFRRRVIVTDSLFSMDGDIAPLAEIAELKRRYDAVLMIDEAHATGVLGENGRGAAQMLGVEDEVDVTVGTLSKALGCLGGFIAGPAALRDTIINSGRAFIYTTALPACICAAAAAAVDVVQNQPQRRRHLSVLSSRLRGALKESGIDCGDSVSQIIPVRIGAADAALNLSRRLLDAGFLVPAIRPPTVPPNSSRLRISLCSGHTEADVDELAAALR